MNVRLLQTAVLAGLIAATGCKGDEDDDDMMGADAKPMDASPDGGTEEDSGTPDTGRPDMGTVVDRTGEEGYECTSTLGPDDTMFKQDNCDPGLLCIPWDLVAGRTDDVTAPVHSCVKPCTSDNDCGAGRFCRPMGFTPESGAGMFCVDEIAETDQFCGGSRTTVSRLPMVSKETRGVMTGCPDNVTCTIGFFGDVHPDEGICINLCENEADCAGSPGTPYCNLLFRSTTSTAALGVCSVGRLGAGAVCGSEDGPGLTRRCDNDLASPVRGDRGGCVAQNLYDGLGFCAQFCGSANPCEGSDEGGPYRCDIFDDTDPMFGGFCNSNCTNFPDNCTADGFDGLGRFCNEQHIVIGEVELNFCMDRIGPSLTPTILERDGQLNVIGDNCEDPLNNLGYAKCPEPFHCLFAGQGVGLCVAGCVLSATTAAGPQGGCGPISATATCAMALQDAMGNPNTVQGLCGD